MIILPSLLALILALPYEVIAATPIGTIESIDSNGVVNGWALDPDNPSAAIIVHIYKDGPAGSGGQLIGGYMAEFPRADVGAHGFRFVLPPVSWDGKSHSYYAYGIDSSGIDAENLALSDSPQTAILNSTIVRMTNGTVTVGIEPRCGGTIAEIIYAGSNLINNYDCTGRQIQAALYDGNNAYDGCASCTGVWGWNPVQGGDRHGFGSRVIQQVAHADSIFIKTQPYEWFPDDKDGMAGQPVLSDVVIEQWLSFVPGEPYAVKVHYKTTHQGSDNHSLSGQEFPAVYVNQGFDRLVFYGGTSPWSGSPVTVTTMESGVLYNAAEKWAAYVNPRNSGLTVYVPGQYPYFSGMRLPDPISGPYSNGFNYMAPFVPFAIEPGAVLEGDIYLIAGDYNLARQSIYNLRSGQPEIDYLPPYGFLDYPLSGQTLSASPTVYGWALDDNKVSRIEILVDNVVVGTASYGQSRPDIPAYFPNASSGTGFIFALNTTQYKNGQHTVSARAIDATGNASILIDPATVTISNVRNPRRGGRRSR